MSDLRKLLFFSRDKNYVDVTRLSVNKKKETFLKQKKIPLKAHSKVFKTQIKKAVKFTKSAQKINQPRKIIKKPKKKLLSEPKIKTLLKPKTKLKISLRPPKEILAGKVTHFFDKIQVCVIKVRNPLKINDTLHFVGKTGDFIQRVDSMQMDHQQVTQAKKGDEIGLKTKREVRPGDKAFIV
ncbi:MAG: hypothetical protein NT079_04965 [Candidatus Omnitrophica bacterium]|nr:hypothetical protein [Candidatus Omnitrophota bacterium]